MIDKIVETQSKAKKLRGIIYVLSQALEYEVNGSIYVDSLNVMEDIADEV